jgi:thioredoxin 2
MPVIRVCQRCSAKNRVPGSHLADVGHCGACKTMFAPLQDPLEVDIETFDEIVKSARVPVLVDFWAEWCRPCHMAAPAVARIASELAGEALVLKVDTERYPQLANRYFIRGIPHFTVFMNGRPVEQHSGLVGFEQLEEWVKGAKAKAELRLQVLRQQQRVG